MGSRLVTEYNPATSQYLYYTQDQIGSTRIVTDDTGTVVYAAAHDPYGGIQKVWADAFDPKGKFSDKERDGETWLDYFGARPVPSFLTSRQTRKAGDLGLLAPISAKSGRDLIPKSGRMA
jgi:hypothetical protein